LGPFLEVAGVLLASMGIFSGAAAAWAWLRDDENVGEAAARGLGAGFIFGIPLTIGAIVVLAVH
jgi:hypothetical protein